VLPRSRRIRATTDILAVLRRGQRSAAPLLTCSYLAKPGTLSRATVIVDTKVSKKAVVRNLCKRRIRAILENTQLPGGDIIVRVRPGFQNLTFQEVKQQLEQCLKRLA
jgi:ribonuclease P protein component